MQTAPAQYRQLDSARILATLTRLRARIEERFPGSGLARVADEMLALNAEVTGFVKDVQQPHWPIRIGAAIAILGMMAVIIVVVISQRMAPGIDGFADFIQAANAAISTLVFLGATALFLLTLENRLRRRKALAILHQLRSIAHVVDMHQLTKDPDRIASPQPDTASSPERSMTAPELGRYLDYCSELLSVISKLGALNVQHFNDPVTLAAVNDIESLTAGLSGKIWQKITLLERERGEAAEEKEPPRRLRPPPPIEGISDED
jgi:hypothetical protein